jgi:hypothetical protein
VYIGSVNSIGNDKYLKSEDLQSTCHHFDVSLLLYFNLRRHLSLVHIQNVERQNVERQKVERQNVDMTKRRHIKTSPITKRRQLQNVEFFSALYKNKYSTSQD